MRYKQKPGIHRVNLGVSCYLIFMERNKIVDAVRCKQALGCMGLLSISDNLERSEAMPCNQGVVALAAPQHAMHCGLTAFKFVSTLCLALSRGSVNVSS